MSDGEDIYMEMCFKYIGVKLTRLQTLVMSKALAGTA
jgi:hypothetical protein